MISLVETLTCETYTILRFLCLKCYLIEPRSNITDFDNSGGNASPVVCICELDRRHVQSTVILVDNI